MHNLALGLCAVQRQRHEQDLEYIMSRLDGEDSDMVVIISTLMKSGSLRKALQDSTTACDDQKGRQLASSTDTLRSLRDFCMRACLMKFEPEKFTKANLADLSKEHLLHIMTIGLHAKEGAKLPREHPILRYEGPLALYLLAVYQAAGNRLKDIDLKKITSDGAGLWSVVGISVGCLLLPDVPLELEVFSSASDWELVDAWKFEATVVSKSQSLTISLAQAFVNAGHGLVEQVSEISAASEALPAPLQLLLLGPGNGAAAQGGHPRPATQGLPAGPGNVKAPARVGA